MANRLFLYRQVEEISKGGILVVLRKLRTLCLRIFDLFILIPLAFLVLLTVRALCPLIKIRFGALITSRIGHYSANTEIYLCEREAGIQDKRAYDIFYNWKPICNYQLKKMWNRVLHVSSMPRLTSWIVRLNRYLPDYEKYAVKINTDRDIHGLIAHMQPHLRFTPEEELFGYQELRRIGIPENAKFVCVHARNSVYLNTLIPQNDWSYHNYRDSDISNLLLAAEELVKRGYYVLRVGVVVEKNLKFEKPGIIDYAAKFRTDFLDIFLAAKCFFYLGGPCGINAVPLIFRKPVAMTNEIPIEYTPTWGVNNLFIPKKLWLRKEHRFMTFSEILSSGTGRFLQTKQYEQAGIDIAENTPEEIAALAIEMDDRLKGVWQITKEDEELQHRFWSLFKQSGLQGKILARIGAEFLRQNRQLLE